MRVLGIETSTRRGSIALVEDGRAILAREYTARNEHGERLLTLVEEVFATAGWNRSSLDRVGVGVGPGNFTGLRIGIAFAQGVALGLERPVFGVCSLRAMALAVPNSVSKLRAPLLDARRGEWFAGLYDVSGTETLAPRVVPKPAQLSDLKQSLPGDWVAVGEVLGELSDSSIFRSPDSELPHATYTALSAATDTEAASAEALYLRPVDAIVPNLPPSPLSSPLPPHDDRDR